MNRAIPAAIVLVAIVCPIRAQDRDSAAGNRIRLFDGESLFGWTATSSADWEVADSTIRVASGKSGFLMTTVEFADFELELDFWATEETNSGVFVRSVENPTDPASDCLEVNIANQSNPFPTGSIVARAKTAKSENLYRRWRKLTIRALGPKVEVVIDGDVHSKIDDANRRRGYIGLQFNSGEARFRNVRLRPLAMQPIFNGADLEGWRTHSDMEGDFGVENRELRVRGGPGQLETTFDYRDFLLQVECKTHARDLNSGIFFRCIPNDRMMGYESQIHNGFADEDRSKPTNCGTGGIFRRTVARRIVANDLEWFRKTIVATDNHIAVWVNGEQVTAWTDQREPHANPRKGCRRDAGTIMIQAHDPTTDLSFKNLRISELPNSE